MLESVPERATKSVDSMKNHNYIERLQKLELPSLQFRREAPTINSLKARIDAAWKDKTNKFTITQVTQKKTSCSERFRLICDQKHST